MDREWAPFELHTHTVHSDGDFSVDELFDHARENGYRGIALTDHNTVSGLSDASAASARTGVALVGGMEWTTFFGHVLIWGDQYFDWRASGPADLAKALVPVREALGITGAAHPFRPGSPFCTGCYWEFETDWKDIDYIEVWSGLDPALQPFNLRAYGFWKGLLNKGLQIRAVSGRDWHRNGSVSARAAASFLSLPRPDAARSDAAQSDVAQSDAARSDAARSAAETSKSAREALKEGCVAVSYGPVPELSIVENSSGVLISVRVRDDTGWGIRISDIARARVRIDSNLGCLSESFDPATELRREIEPQTLKELQWVNAEILGSIGGDPDVEEKLLGFSNPEFFDA